MSDFSYSFMILNNSLMDFGGDLAKCKAHCPMAMPSMATMIGFELDESYQIIGQELVILLYAIHEIFGCLLFWVVNLESLLMRS
jgi:hypothetical protein